MIWISQAKCTLNGQRERRRERSLNSKVLWGWGMGWDVEMKMDNVRNCRFDFYQRKYIFNWRENSVWMRGNCFRFSDNLFCHYHPCNTPLCAHILYFHLIGKTKWECINVFLPLHQFRRGRAKTLFKSMRSKRIERVSEDFRRMPLHSSIGRDNIGGQVVNLIITKFMSIPI